jgi:capsular exopolysaccharide synthesis family protein
MISEPLSQLSQAVHAMRIALELSGAMSKVILVTSAIPAEGKSTTAMLLAASCASSGKRAILLECDLHQPSASGLVGNKRQPGLSEFLQGKVAISEVITRDPVTKTYVMPAGSVMPNAAECLLSKRMRDLIHVLRGEFDYVVIDAPPLLLVVDTLVLATIADKVLVIVAWDHTPRANISAAFKLLGPEAHRVAGIVLNKVDLAKMPEYGYGRYRYQLLASA